MSNVPGHADHAAATGLIFGYSFGSVRKALVAALVAFLAPVGSYLALTGDWSWRAFAASCITGLIAGGGTFATPNEPVAPPAA